MSVLKEAYSSEAKMDAVTERIHSLKLSDYEKDCRFELRALMELRKDLELLSPTAHPQLRGDLHKRSFL